MDNKGLISVIVPVYNVEKYLWECIDSVLKQTYTNFEVILVDDGSKDSSKYICEEYAVKDARIKVMAKENGGASSARNLGLTVAKGEYIYFLDSDDWIVEDALEKLLKICESSHAEVVFFDAYSVDEETGKVTTSHYSHKKNYQINQGYRLMEELISNKDFHVAPWLFFIRKDLLDRKRLKFEEGIIYEDMIFTYKLFCESQRAVHLPEYLYYRRYRENSVMTSRIKKKNFDSAIKVYYEVHDYWKKLPDDRKSERHVVRCAYNGLNVFERLSSSDKKVCRDKYKRLKKDILNINAYDDRALKARCYSKLFWIGYKVLGKIGLN